MSHKLQPSRLRDQVEYHAALRELEQLFLCDPNSPAGHRFDHLVAIIDEFDCRPGNGMPASNEDPCSDRSRQPPALPKTQQEAERERRLYGVHADPLTDLPTTEDPECDLAREATIRR